MDTNLRLKPLGTLAHIRERIDQLSEQGGTWHPQADWFETDDDLVLILDAPGVDVSSFELEHDGETIVLAGKRLETSWGRELFCERPKGSFERRLQLPEAIEPGSGEAQYRGGLIEVRFRKLGRTITVNPSE